MPLPHAPLRKSLTWQQIWPSLRAALWASALFGAALMLASGHAETAQALLTQYPRLGLLVFVGTSALAVLLPALSNLPLVPFAVLAWGPWATAALLLVGWIVGATLSFALGRHARDAVMRLLPSARRHADIDRLIMPDHRLLSLSLLRMTFPVDVLSYALGLFSRSTTATQCAASTAMGAAPFALLFAFFPTLSAPIQGIVLAISVVGFALYAAWVIRRAEPEPGI